MADPKNCIPAFAGMKEIRKSRGPFPFRLSNRKLTLPHEPMHNSPPETEIVGSLHIHSRYSDGAGSVREVANAAKRAGLDFIAFNDHAYMTDALHAEEEGFYDGVLVLMALEIGGRYHHYLAYDLKEMVSGLELGPQAVIDRVSDLGGFGFLAHPFEKGMPFSEKSVAYTWNDLTVKGFAGICIWNFSSRWKERVKTALHALYFLTFKSQTLKGPSSETLAFWDKLCRDRQVVAIGGSDAHGTRFKWGPFNFVPLSYEHTLGAVTVHLLLEKDLPQEVDGAKQLIYDALRKGRLFIAHEHLAPARGFRFHYACEQGIQLTMGEEAPFQPGVFSIRLPRKGLVRLIRDGVVKQWREREVAFKPPGPGVYRVEVFCRLPLFGWRPWIYSNPIYLR